MKRQRARVAVSLTSIAWLVAFAVRPETAVGLPVAVYAFTARICLRAAEAVSHPHLLVPVTLGIAAALAVVAVCAAGMQLHRTRKRLSSLASCSMERLPVGVERLADRLGLRGRVDVIEYPGLIAFAHGLIRPRIVVSSGLVDTLDEDELEAVLWHERAHVLSLDPLRVLLARSLSTAFAFVPFAGSFLEAYLAERELAADRSTVREMDDDVIPLASALHRALIGPARPELAGLAVGALSATDVRIAQLLGVPTSSRVLLRPPGRLHALAFSFVVVAAICLLLASAQTATAAGLCIPC